MPLINSMSALDTKGPKGTLTMLSHDYDDERARDFVAFTFRHPDEHRSSDGLRSIQRYPCYRPVRGGS